LKYDFETRLKALWSLISDENKLGNRPFFDAGKRAILPVTPYGFVKESGVKKMLRHVMAWSLLVASFGVYGCKGPKAKDGKCVEMPSVAWYPSAKVDMHDVCLDKK